MENNNAPKDTETGIGRYVGIRHHYSGVWVGQLLGYGIMPHMIRIHGRRLWSWRGERLECSQVFGRGPLEEDKLGDPITVDIPVGVGDGLVELTFDVSEETYKAFMDAPITKV